MELRMPPAAVAALCAIVAVAGLGAAAAGPAALACIGTVAGVAPVEGQQALLRTPAAVAFDTWGNLYISTDTYVLLAAAGDGSLTVWAGDGTIGYSGDGGLATLAQLNTPRGLAVDAAGDLLIADAFNYVIRKVWAANGTIITIAGNASLSPGFGGDGGPAALAVFAELGGVLVEPGSGDILIADKGNNVVRRISAADGAIATVAGFFVPYSIGNYSGDGGPATLALMNYPSGLALDGAGNLFIADFDNNVVRAVWAATGTITTVAGNASLYARDPDNLDNGGYGGDGGLATDAQLNGPQYLALDAAGDLLVSDTVNNVVRRVSAATGVITTVAGNFLLGFGHGGDGGPATSAQLFGPNGIAVSPEGALFIADAFNNAIRAVDAAVGNISLQYGLASSVVRDGGPATASQLASAAAVAVDRRSGDVLLADSDNCVVRRVSAATGVIATVAGSAARGCGYGGDDGPASAAQLYSPASVEVEEAEGFAGDLLIADTGNNIVRAVSASTGIITTVAGSFLLGGGYNGDGIPATTAQLFQPYGAVRDAARNVYIADAFNSLVRVVWAANGTIGSFVGTYFGGQGYSGDGGPASQAQVNYPVAVAIDRASGDLYISDGSPPNPAAPTQFGLGSNVVRRVSAASGNISTVAGNFSLRNYKGAFAGAGGPATLAQLTPWGLAVDEASGDLLVADGFTGVYRVSAATGTLAVVAGDYALGRGYSGNGGPASAAQLSGPRGVALDAFGNVLIAEVGNAVVRVAVAAGAAGIACPVGFACGCGTPLPCTPDSGGGGAAGGFCPGGQLAPLPVTSRFYAAPDVPPDAPRSLQLPCPPGYYCAGGRRVPCAAGSFGALPLQLSQAACASCPAGTYNALESQTSGAACVPCPPGTFTADAGSSLCSPCPVNTFSAAAGAAMVGASRSGGGEGGGSPCAACPNGTIALGGAAACFVADAAALITVNAAPVGGSALPTSFTTLQLLQVTTPDVAVQKTKAIDFSVGTAVPVAIAGMIPLLLLAGAYAGCCCCAWMSEPLAVFRRLDVYPLLHFVPVGASPVKRVTRFGGTMTVAAAFTLLALTSTLLVQYYTDNVLVQQGTLPALLPTLVSLTAPGSPDYVPVHRLEPAAAQAAALPLRAGLSVSVQAAGAAVLCTAVAGGQRADRRCLRSERGHRPTHAGRDAHAGLRAVLPRAAERADAGVGRLLPAAAADGGRRRCAGHDHGGAAGGRGSHRRARRQRAGVGLRIGIYPAHAGGARRRREGLQHSRVHAGRAAARRPQRDAPRHRHAAAGAGHGPAVHFRAAAARRLGGAAAVEHPGAARHPGRLWARLHVRRAR